MENEKEVILKKVEGKHVYIMVPRKLIISWITTTSILFVMSLASFQYTNYVDRKSNGIWCGIVGLIDDRNQSNPSPPPNSQEFYIRFHDLRTRLLHCS